MIRHIMAVIGARDAVRKGIKKEGEGMKYSKNGMQ